MTFAANLVRTIGLALGIAAFAGSAHAALIGPSGGLTLDTDPSTIFGQTAASPCVIGGNNCQNPSGFAFTLAGSGGAGSTFNETSPTYQLSDIATVLGGNSFMIGIDYNQSSVAQTLFSFTADYDIGTDQTFSIATVLPTNNNGVGFSDFILSGFDIPLGATTVTFSASWFNNSGADRYFLIGANTPTTTVPEPSSLALLGSMLIGLGALARRRRNTLQN